MFEIVAIKVRSDTILFFFYNSVRNQIRFILKLLQRVMLTLLPNVCNSKPGQSKQLLNLQSTKTDDNDDDFDENIAIPAELEDVIDAFIVHLATSDSNARWMAAKGIGTSIVLKFFIFISV